MPLFPVKIVKISQMCETVTIAVEAKSQEAANRGVQTTLKIKGEDIDSPTAPKADDVRWMTHTVLREVTVGTGDPTAVKKPRPHPFLLRVKRHKGARRRRAGKTPPVLASASAVSLATS